jgi:hypothetical protein
MIDEIKPPVIKNEPLGDRLSIRTKLGALGWNSVSAWARAYGYERTTVDRAIKVWGHRTDRKPHGGYSTAVVNDLRKTMNLGIRPQDVTADQQAA